jgi:L-aminopeptidase/D-esterase-like protein
MASIAERLAAADLPGVRVGHATDPVGRTGCTVVLATDGAVAGVDVRGSAPGTRGTDALRPTGIVDRLHAVCLCGGSAFGLAAADGVTRWLAERGIGFEMPHGRVPIVAAAVIYDLGVGSPAVYATPDMGMAACEAAMTGDEPVEGQVGVGIGASVGKLGGAEPAPGGVGISVARADGWRVGAIVVVNAVGDVIGPDGRIVAGGRRSSGTGPTATASATPPGNTTLAVVVTDAPLDRAQCTKLAELGHDGLARAISPVHTLFDGDTVFALSTAPREVGGSRALDGEAQVGLGMVAVEVVQDAIVRAVTVGRRAGG